MRDSLFQLFPKLHLAKAAPDMRLVYFDLVFQTYRLYIARIQQAVQNEPA